MLTCKQTTEMATDRSEGNLGFLDRRRFDRHLEGCDGCRAYVRQLQVAARAVARLPAPDVSPALSDALMAQFDSAAAAGTRARAPERAGASPWPILGTVVMLGLLLAFGRTRSQAPQDWILGAVLAGAALAVAALAGRIAVGIVVAAASAALAAALFAGNPGALAADHGLVCLPMELVSAAVVGGAAWLGARGVPGATPRRWLAAGAVAGALVADAALQITCGVHDSMPHLLAFHLGGVVLVAGAALLALRSRVGGAIT
jgi:hypothetical protein